MSILNVLQVEVSVQENSVKQEQKTHFSLSWWPYSQHDGRHDLSRATRHRKKTKREEDVSQLDDGYVVIWVTSSIPPYLMKDGSWA